MKQLKIGMIGLDSSHASAFTEILNDESHQHHVAGGKVICTYKGGSDDLPISMNRVESISAQLKEAYNIPLYNTVQEVMEHSDAVILTAVDARKRLEQIKEIISFQKPIFIDKPLALNTVDTNEINRLAQTYGTPIMTSSALRFSTELSKVLRQNNSLKIIGADCFGPLEFIENIHGYYWYGIHTIEMLSTILGTDYQTIEMNKTDLSEIITITYKDGSIGTVRGIKKGNAHFGGIIHFENGSVPFDVRQDSKPFYAALLEEIINFFHTKQAIINIEESIKIITIIENINNK